MRSRERILAREANRRSIARLAAGRRSMRSSGGWRIDPCGQARDNCGHRRRMAPRSGHPPPWKRKARDMWVDASFVREIAGRLRAAGCPVDEKLRRRGIAGRPLASGDSISLAAFVELLERGAEW